MVIKILSKGFQGKIINYVQNDLINPHRGTWKIMKRKTKWLPNKVNSFKITYFKITHNDFFNNFHFKSGNSSFFYHPLLMVRVKRVSKEGDS